MMQTRLVDFLRKQLADKPAVIGLSGGLDSTVVVFLVAKSIPAQRIYGLILPSDTNMPSDQADAEAVAQQLGIHYQTISIDPLVAAFKQAADFFTDRLPVANLKARLRMCLLYGKANNVGGLVIGTGNKSELLSGYFTKYGDGGVDLFPLGDLYKTQVWELAKELQVPPTIIAKPPTAGLWLGQTDEAELGMPYQTLDAILHAMERRADLTQFSSNQVQRVRDRYEGAHHKLSPAIIAKLT